jgi:hypothetical protein
MRPGCAQNREAWHESKALAYLFVSSAAWRKFNDIIHRRADLGSHRSWIISFVAGHPDFAILA